MIPDRFTTIGRIAWADFLQRARSRQLLVILAVIAYIGYQLNVGAFELLYIDTVDGQTVNYRGEPTSAYVGLTSGVLIASILFFFGYYILSGSIRRDRSTGVNELVASTPVTDRSYLLGKWFSHVALVFVLLAILGFAALLNHWIHGVGVTNPLWIFGAIFLIGAPVGCLVAGVTIFFQSINRLTSTLGNILYLLVAATLFSMIYAVAFEQDTIPTGLRPGDLVGLFVAGDMTFEALLSAADDYSGPAVANFGAGADDAEIVQYHWDGSAWPNWFYANRVGLILGGIGFAVAAAYPFERFDSSGNRDRRSFVKRVVQALPARFPGTEKSEPSETTVQSPAEVSLTPVTDRNSGSFGRLLIQELRLLVRDQPWWWYVGAVLIAFIGASGSASTAVIVPIAAVWPLFLWSSMGFQSVRYRITPFIVSSKYPYGQLLAEWLAGVIVAAVFLGISVWPTVITTGAEGVIVLLGAVVFIPSLAQTAGLWSGTRRLFEMSYLILWYVGPLNGFAALDFAGATSETAGTMTPLLFLGIGLIALATVLIHRYVQT